MASDLSKLIWTRPKTSEYPKVWSTFKARDLDSDELVEYRVQDLPESRFEDAINHMVENFFLDEPITQALGASTDPDFIADNKLALRSILQQKCALACFREVSEEIVGVNMTYVCSKDDQFFKEAYERCKGSKTKELYNIFFTLYGDFDVLKKYDASEYFGAYGLSVDRRYRGRRIGFHILEARKNFCREFGVKITHTIFTSDASNVLADKIGFRLDKGVTYDELSEEHPEFHLKGIKSKQLTLKTLVV